MSKLIYRGVTVTLEVDEKREHLFGLYEERRVRIHPKHMKRDLETLLHNIENLTDNKKVYYLYGNNS